MPPPGRRKSAINTFSNVLTADVATKLASGGQFARCYIPDQPNFDQIKRKILMRSCVKCRTVV